MKHRVASTLALISILATLALQATMASALSEDAAWGIVPSPNASAKANELAGLAVLGSNDIWAVGRYNTGRPPTVTGRDTLALHWDGTAWTVVSTPNPTWSGADYFSLEDAAGTASNDVWAVGDAEDFASLKSTTLIEHWNGSAWSIVQSPNPGGRNLPNQLNAVAIASPTDIWAVGLAGYPEDALTLRYNGSRWRPVRNGCGVALQGVDVVSSSDVWAVGTDTTCHFDGSSWSVIPSPQPRGQYSEIAYVLQDVSAVASNDVWVSGYRVIEFGEYLEDQSIVEHWDGNAWTLTTDVDGHELNGIEALGSNDVWAVGTDATRGVVVHFDGTGWNLVPSPTPKDSGVLSDVEAESSDHLWAAGTSLGSSPGRTLILESPSRFDGTVEGDTHVSGATVSWFGPETGSVETDVSGAYSIAGLAAGTYHLVATDPGCSPASAQVPVVAGVIVHQDLILSC
jgi:hypothetical protein